jgi:hypothetical protein
MFGSRPREFTLTDTPRTQVYSVQVGDRAFWAWERRSRSSRVLARSAQLFPDYATCLCDAERHA